MPWPQPIRRRLLATVVLPIALAGPLLVACEGESGPNANTGAPTAAPAPTDVPGDADGAPAPATEAPSGGTPSEAAGLGAVKSDGGHFVVAYRSDAQPVPLNAIHAWDLTISTPDGTPVTGAHVVVDGGMPAHDHGLPTAPAVTETGAGVYRVEGLKFHMPGAWVVNVTITQDDVTDTATVALNL